MLNLLKRNDIINSISNILAIFLVIFGKIGKKMINYKNMKHFVMMKCSHLFDI